MRKKIGVLYTILIVAVVAILFATTLYHISYSLEINSYFNSSSYFASSEIFKIGGLSYYIAAFFSQNVWLVIAYIALAAAIISHSFIQCSKTRYEPIAISLVALTMLYSGYVDTKFALQITSCLLVSLATILMCYLFRKGRVVGFISLPFVLALLYLTILKDKSVYIFAVIITANILISLYVLPLYKSKNIISYLLVLSALAGGFLTIFKGYNSALAHVMKMEQAAVDDDWNGVLDLAKQAKFSNQLTCYYTNLSLIKSGQLSKYLFYFPQISGSSGFNMSMDFQRLNDEIYDLMGLPNQALRCTFENYIVYGKSYYNLKRLIYYYNKCGKENISAKFLAMLPDYTPPKPSGYITTGVDSTVSNNNNFIYILETIVEKDKNNKTAFEILMACYALDGRVSKFAELCMYSSNHFEDGLPTYFQEVLLVYENAMAKSSKPFIKFEIDSEIRKQYIQFNNTKSHRDYQGSYWYYMNYINPSKNKIYIE